jgi:hypothetical protein
MDEPIPRVEVGVRAGARVGISVGIDIDLERLGYLAEFSRQ